MVLFPKRAPKVAINDRFYKVFSSTLSEAPKRCVANGFLMFCYVVKGYQNIVENLMLFGTFWGQNAKRAPKASINDRFYKGLGMGNPPCGL